MYQTAIYILKKLSNLGYEAYIIGGYVRDLYLKFDSTDIDICTNAKPEELRKIFEVIIEHPKFGSVIIKQNDYNFEITTFRRDEYKNSRYPKIYYVDTLKEDLERRDFTINTLCIDKDENLVDYMNGMIDLENKRIRCIGDISLKFSEDPIRILRAIRFSCKYNFKLEKSIISEINKQKHKLSSISKNLVNREIKKILELPEGKKFLLKFNLKNYIH